MRIHLMFRERSFDKAGKEPWNAKRLVGDLDLEPILDAMAGGDDYVRDVAAKALLSGVDHMEDILFRQEALKDALKSPDTIRLAYQTLSGVVAEAKRRWLWSLSNTPDGAVFDSVRLLEAYLGGVDGARETFLQNRSAFSSRAFTSLIEAFERFFDKEYTDTLRENLAELEFPKGVSVQVTLGGEAELSRFKLIRPARRTGLRRVLPTFGGPRYTWTLPPRDEAGGQELENIKNLSLEGVAKVLSVASQHVLEFVESLRVELAFYVGCLNLWGRLSELGVPLCFPTPLEGGRGAQRFRCLVEASLALRKASRPVCNSLDTGGRPLLLVSGANRGGKTVFLRSLGQAQLMMMCGMFVAAEEFESPVSTGIYTHFKVDEEANLKEGRLEEEVARMSEIVEHIRPGSLLLMNESFSSTNEREGSEIARQVLCALADRGVRVAYVTHFYEVQKWLAQNRKPDTLFLRAERREDGTRTYRMVLGEPEDTSFAEDVYLKVFGDKKET